MNDLEPRHAGFFFQENLVHPALTAHPAPKRVLIVGGADGGSAAQALKHPAIELHSRSGDEAPAFLRETEQRFDLIALDADGPLAPPDGLDTPEFLRSCRLALAPGGALATPIGLPLVQPQRVAELAQRLNGLFRLVRPYALFVPLAGTLCALAVCSDKLDPKSFTADEIDRRIEQRRLPDLRFYNGEAHEGVFALPNYLRELVNPPRLKLPMRGRRLDVVRGAAK
ncbi:MAG: hypothetical protein EPO27_16430 [Betaproteobacteria bacterium]|nr:MAG: hypothetical protein EPO27_16430 [Betaproteobacteria bacterium]